MSGSESTEQKIDRALDWFTVGTEECSKQGKIRTADVLSILESAKSDAKQALLSLIAEERLDELNHLGFDKRLDDPIISCYNEELFGAITLDERKAQLQALSTKQGE